LYLASKAKEVGAPVRFIELANQVNVEMPILYVQKAIDLLGQLENKRILIVGVSYKPNVADVRETPVAALITGLRNQKAQVFWHDELVKEWNGEKSVDLTEDYDLAIISTPHDNLNLTRLGKVLQIHAPKRTIK
jgi:UDP-N-acetyl-D-glucosamine dehydrogenase